MGEDLRADSSIPTVSNRYLSGVPVPYLVGDFRRVFAPANGRYLNDHTLARADDGRWHLYGITHTSAASPQEERSLLHATAPSLLGPWEERPDVLTATGDEQVLWAPFVFRPEGAPWRMIYWGGTNEAAAVPVRGLRVAVSDDLERFTRIEPRATGGRDPFVLRADGRWLLFSVSVSSAAHGQIVVSESDDLTRWSDGQVVIEDPVPSFAWGNLESPFVVRVAGAWYLFLTRTGESHADYNRTLVFRSDDVRRFAWQPLTELRTHAAEVIDDHGVWYITAAGWTSELGALNRGLSVARLGWTVSE